MNIFNNLSVGQLIVPGIIGYAGATYFSYKYNAVTKAQDDLRKVSDKKSYLLDVHQKIAEKYDSIVARREFSNKLDKYRRVLLSYAEGDVLECGIGTGKTLQYYNIKRINSFMGIDWSTNMLMKAFEKVDELKNKNGFPFESDQVVLPWKLTHADSHDLHFEDDKFDTVVDCLTL
jgi:ubiquinone/menaquinone biosynthesis C-methylase UbiE